MTWKLRNFAVLGALVSLSAFTATAFSLFKGGGGESGITAPVDVEGSEHYAARGVPASLLEKYSGSVFMCDAGKKLSSSQVNDGFCDCEDGTDEPGTSACSNGVFHCINKGYRITTLPASRVDDQVCDCCDGSDEGVYAQCLNTCQEAAAREKATLEKIRNAYETGSKIREELTKKSRTELSGLIEQLPGLIAEHDALTQSFNGAQSKLNEARAADTEHREALRQQKRQEIFQYLGANEWNVKSVAACLSNLLNVLGIQEESEVRRLLQFNEIKDFHRAGGIDELVVDSDGVGNVPLEDGYDGEYNHDEYNDEVVRSPEMSEGDETVSVDEKPCDIAQSDARLIPLCAVGDDHVEKGKELILSIIKDRQAFKETMLVVGFYITSGSWEHSDKFALDAIADTATGCPSPFSPSVCSMQASINRLCTERDDLEKMDSFLAQQFDFQQKEVNELRDKMKASEAAKKKAETAQKDLDFYSDNLEFLALKNECFTMADGKYTYSVCILGDVTQQEEGGGSKVLLGKFDAIDEGRDEKGSHFLTMRYTKGQHCHVHGARKADVNIACGATHSLKSSTEPATCSYVLEFESPLACTAEFAKINGLL